MHVLQCFTVVKYTQDTLRCLTCLTPLTFAHFRSLLLTCGQSASNGVTSLLMCQRDFTASELDMASRIIVQNMKFE